MHVGVVAGELERHRVGMPAHDRRLAGAELARRLGQPRLAADDAGRSAANATSSSGLRAMARRQPVTARLNGSVGDSFEVGFGLMFDDIYRALLNQMRMWPAGNPLRRPNSRYPSFL